MRHPIGSSQPLHQVLADGEVIYSGTEWTQAFLQAAFHPSYQHIVHLENGRSGACWGPIIATHSAQEPLFPPPTKAPL